MGQPYRRSETAVFLLNYHLIWCPKRRRKILGGSIAERLEQLLRETANELGCEVIELAIQPDHVHFFVSATPDLAPNQIVARVKGKSSRILRQEFPYLMKCRASGPGATSSRPPGTWLPKRSNSTSRRRAPATDVLACGFPPTRKPTGLSRGSLTGLDAPLERLVSEGVLRKLPVEPTGRKGRPAGPVYEVLTPGGDLG
jgi:putative transposase